MPRSNLALVRKHETLLPPAPSTLAARAHIAHIVAPSSTPPADVSPVDPAPCVTTSGMMIAGTAQRRDSAGNDPGEGVFDFGFDDLGTGPIQLPTAERSGEYNRDELLGLAGETQDHPSDVLEITMEIETPQNSVPTIDAQWEMYPPAIPTIPTLHLQPHELVTVPPRSPTPSPEKLAGDIVRQAGINPYSKYKLVASIATRLSSEQRERFFKALEQRTTVAVTEPQSPNIINAIVQQHTALIEHIAFSVVEHERASGCWETEALIYGFYCLPTYKHEPTKLALRRELTNSIRLIKDLDKNRPHEPVSLSLYLEKLTPATLKQLPEQDRKIAQAVAKAVSTGIDQKQEGFDVLSNLVHQFPQQRALVFHFYKLLKKGPTDAKVPALPEKVILANYQSRIDHLVAKIILACDQQGWSKLPSQLDIAFHSLPGTLHRDNQLHLRRAISKRTHDAQKKCITGVVAVDDKMEAEMTDTVLGLLYHAAKNNQSVDQVKVIAIQRFNGHDEDSLPMILHVLHTSIANYQKFHDQLAHRADECIEAFQQKPLDIQAISQGYAAQCTPATKKLFLAILHDRVTARKHQQKQWRHDRVTETITHTDPADRAKVIAKITGENKGLAPLLYTEDLKDPFLVASLPGKGITAQTVNATIDGMITELDNKIPRVELEDVEVGVWASMKRGWREATKQVRSWISSVTSSIENFDFMNFLRSHKQAVAFSTAVAAIASAPAYHAVAVAAESNIHNIAPESSDTGADNPMPAHFQEAAFGRYLGTNEKGAAQMMNFTTTIPQHYRTAHTFAATQANDFAAELTLVPSVNISPDATPGYVPVTPHGSSNITFYTHALRVDESGQYANIYNVLSDYMRSNAFRLAYPKYQPGEHDQTALYEGLRDDHANRAHHLLHRVASGDHITLGITSDGNLTITEWTNARGMNMLLDEPTIVFNAGVLPNLGGFSRSTKMQS